MKLKLFGLLLFCLLSPLQARTTLVFWHAMAGHLGEEVNALASQFNHSQNAYTLKPVYKGNYLETLNAFAAAFRAGKPPAMVQIFEVGSGTMLRPRGVIKPVAQLMREQGLHLPEEDFIPIVRDYYSEQGQLMAMPFNLSVPVMYYNRKALASVGYDQENFPKTWQAFEVMAGKLRKKGYDCVYTTAYPGWTLVESYLALHGLPIVEGKPQQAVYNTQALTHHFKRLLDWQAKGYFRYGGRVDDATVLFSAGICPVFSQSSGAHNSLAALLPFPLGVAPMLLDEDLAKDRYPDVFGGAAIWLTAGQKPEVEKGVAQFLVFLAKPETQRYWQENSGYLPIGLSGIYQKVLLNNQHPTLKLAQIDLLGARARFSAERAGPLNQIREINDAAMEAMFAGLKSPETTLEEAQASANHLLLRFRQNTGS